MTEKINMDPVDRTGWAPGPWDDEPDRIEWRDEATGLPCLITRHRRYGNLCAYVAVPPGHPWHGVQFGELDVESELTYSDLCSPESGICHVPLPGEPEDVWWLGMDYAHSGDVSPGMDAHLRALGQEPFEYDKDYPWKPIYKPVGFVREMTTMLAAEVAEAAK